MTRPRVEARPRREPDAAGYAIIALLSLVWGSAFLLMKVAVAEATPRFVALMRCWIGIATVVGVGLLLGRRIPRRPIIWAWCLGLSALGVSFPFWALATASVVLPSGVVGVYMAAIPLMALPMIHFLSPVLGLNDPVTPEKAAGLALGAIGVVCLFGLETFAALGEADAWAQLLCLAAATSYALGVVALRAMPPATDPVGAAGLQLFLGALTLSVVYGAEADGVLWPNLSFSAWGAIAGLAIGATGVGMILRVHMITSYGPVFMSSVGYLVPLTALAVGAALGGERFSAADLIGAALILGGVAVSRGAFGAIWTARAR